MMIHQSTATIDRFSYIYFWSFSGASIKPFVMDFDLVIKNIEDLNTIAGEGEHYIQHTKDGARLQVTVLQLAFFVKAKS